MIMMIKRYGIFSLFCKRAPDQKCLGARLILSLDGCTLSHVNHHENMARRQLLGCGDVTLSQERIYVR
jgi:hypothetical protein